MPMFTIMTAAALLTGGDAAAPSSTQEPFPRIIKPDVARNTIIVYVLSLLIALATCIAIFPKTFPTAWTSLTARLLPKGRTCSKTGRGSSIRVRLLFAAALMSMGDSINNIIMIQSADSTGNAQFVVYHLLRGITFLTAGPLFVMAMASRIAIIVVMRPKWKTWFLRGVYAFTVYIMIQQQVVLVIGVVQRLGSSPAAWIDASMWPFWTTGTMALLPVFSIGGSLVALRIAFSSQSTTPAAASSSGTMSSSAATSSSTSQPHVSAAAATSHGKTATQIEDRTSTLKYPLTNTFATLNAAMVVEWIAFIACALIQNSPFVVRISSLSGFLTSLAILTETSFEWLLKRSQKIQKERKVSRKKQLQQQQPKSQTHIAASRHLSGKELSEGTIATEATGDSEVVRNGQA